MDLSPQAKAFKKAKIIKWDYTKLKSFCTVKETVTKMKRPPTEEETIFVNDMSGKALLPKSRKQLIQVNMF